MLYGTFQVCLSSGVRIWYVVSDLAMNDDGRGIQLDCPWNKGESRGSMSHSGVLIPLVQ